MRESKVSLRGEMMNFGDELIAKRDDIVKKNLNLAEYFARRFAKKYNKDYAELHDVGVDTLIRVANKSIAAKQEIDIEALKNSISRAIYMHINYSNRISAIMDEVSLSDLSKKERNKLMNTADTKLLEEVYQHGAEKELIEFLETGMDEDLKHRLNINFGVEFANEQRNCYTVNKRLNNILESLNEKANKPEVKKYIDEKIM